VAKSPRILYVSSVWPETAAFGGELRSSNVLRALQKIGAVETLILKDDATCENLSEEFSRYPAARALEVRQRPNEGLVEKISWMLNPRRSYPNGCSIASGALRNVVRHIREFDLTWFFQLRSPDAFPNAVWPRSVVDIDNLPSMYERATLESGVGARELLLASRRLVSWRRREKLLGERFDVLAVCGEEDRNYLKRLGIRVPIHVIPNGFSCPATPPVRNPATPPRIGFIGLFGYPPNLEGVRWFVNKCWPHIKHELPTARLRLIGRDSDGALKPSGADIDGLGWLANTSDEISTWSAMVVPLRVGAGTRVKIAHAFSEKCPIISTTLGARGYEAVNGRQMFLADSAGEFSDACIKVIREPGNAAQMAERAWQEFVTKWTWEAIAPRVWSAAEVCLRIAALHPTEWTNRGTC
jgi:glycosyltransferase involved in cell wall biosynthesis